jgi:hypothetical protein
MAWIDKLDVTYYLETSNSKTSIVNALKERIDSANKNKSWISFEDNGYENMRIDDYRMIIKRNSRVFDPFGGKGVIIIHFSQPDNQLTHINAEIKPVKIGLWLAFGLLTLISALLISVTPGAGKYAILVIAWVGIMTISYLNIVFSRYMLKEYLKEVLAGIGIKDELRKR